MYYPKKVRREFIVKGVRATDFDDCASALTEARAELAKRTEQLTRAQADGESLAKQRDEALRIVKDYREGHVCYKVDHNGIKRDFRCSICIAADEALGGK